MSAFGSRVALEGVDAQASVSRILLVEDDPRNRRLVTDLLARDGYVVSACASGAEALGQLASNAFDAVVTDVMMPRMDGFELTRRIRAHPETQKLPVLMMTALDDRTSRLHAFESGADDFLSKPLDAVELSVRIRNLVRLKRSRDALAWRNEQLEALVAERTQQIRRSEAFLRNTLDALSARVGILDEHGRLVAVNEAWREFGRRRGLSMDADGIGAGYAQVCRALLPDADRTVGAMDAGIARVLAGEVTAFSWEYEVPENDGPASYLMSVTKFHGAEGRHVVVSHADLTELRKVERALLQSEQRLRHAQRMESIGALAGGIAHDFNNLLSVIFSYADTLREELPPESVAVEDLDQILEATRRASTLTRQLLAFSRKQVLKTTTTTFNEIIENTQKMLRRLLREDIELRLALDPNPAHVGVDVGQIEQVLMNLVVNARDAMPEGGTILISTGRRLIGSEEAVSSVLDEGEYAWLCVRDSGVGMDQATQRRVFEPFYTTKGPAEGTGLGLSTVLGIVEQSGGTVEVESELGAGASFTILLPSVESAESGEFAQVSLARVRGPNSKRTVLVVEDEPLVRLALRHLLAESGYDVATASNGDDALARTECGMEHLDLLLSDVVMPGMGGLALADRIRERFPKVQVIMMTGYVDEAVTRARLQDARVSVLEKPFAAQELLAAVAAALGVADASD